MKDLESIDPEFYNSLVWIKYVLIQCCVVCMNIIWIYVKEWNLGRILQLATSKNTIILFKVQVWVVLDVSLILSISFVFITNCTCHASTCWQFAYGAHLYMNTQCYVLAFLHVL